MLGSKKPDKVKNKTKALDPNINEDKPESILKSSWVFQPENKHVFYDRYDIKVQKTLGCIAASNSGLYEAKKAGQRSCDKPEKYCNYNVTKFYIAKLFLIFT